MTSTIASSSRSKSESDGSAPDLEQLAAKFPRDFIFGAATSAYQIEGAVDEGEFGRGSSIWDTFFRERPDLDTGEIAIDHYRRMVDDVALMSELKLRSYRFSVSWPRILPRGRGSINSKGLDFYERLVDELLKRSIVPNLTLYHWDLPQEMENLGGWLSRDVAAYFSDYCAVVAKRLGDRVPFWTTLNEPEVITSGYIGRELAPGYDNRALRMRAIHTLLLAHGLGLSALRATLSQSTRVGIVLNLVPIDPLDAAAAAAAHNRWVRDYAVYLEAITKGGYPAEVADEILSTGVDIRAGDMAVIAAKIDLLGLNWYLRLVVDEHDRIVEVPGAERTLMGWEIRSEALTRTLLRINQDYRLPPIYITENGAALRDTVEDGVVNDYQRRNYLADHLEAIAAAVDRGVDVRGYYAWSLFDNLEWSLGFEKTFGLVHVDRKTMKRTPKLSGNWYRNLIEAHQRAPRSAGAETAKQRQKSES